MPTQTVTSPSEQSNPSPEGLGLGASPGSEDYFAVNRCIGKKTYSHCCNVLAKDSNHAMRIARDQGFQLGRGSYANRIGRAGYYAALRRVF